MKKRRLLLFVLFFFLVLGCFTVFGENGIFHFLRLQKELTQIKEANLKMEEENQRLREEVRWLKYEKRYIEEIARKELGMVQEEELIYLFDLPAKGEEKNK